MTQRILEGDALAKFNTAATTLGNETNQQFILCLQAVTRHVFPQKALQYQRRYMRRYLRKPRDMRTREFNARLQELNLYLGKFPPFGGDAQKLDKDDLVEVLVFLKVMLQKAFRDLDFLPFDLGKKVHDECRKTPTSFL